MRICPSCGEYSIVRCDACRRAFEFDPGMVAAKRMAQEARTCPLCREQLSSLTALRTHLIETHGAQSA